MDGQNSASGEWIVKGAISSGHIETGGEARMEINRRSLFLKEAIKNLEAAVAVCSDADSEVERAWVIGQIEAYKDMQILNEHEYKTWIFRVDRKCLIAKA